MKNSLYQKEIESKAKKQTEEIFNGRRISVQRDTLQFPDHTYQWEMVLSPAAVAAIPVMKNGKIILIQQWRRTIEQIIYELPAGLLEPDESPLKAIERELQEEIGYHAASLIHLGGFYLTPGFCTEYIYLFVAKDLTPSSLPGDLHEAIDVVEMGLEEALGLIDSNEIQDAKTIAGLLWYQRWLTGI